MFSINTLTNFTISKHLAPFVSLAVYQHPDKPAVNLVFTINNKHNPVIYKEEFPLSNASYDGIRTRIREISLILTYKIEQQVKSYTEQLVSNKLFDLFMETGTTATSPIVGIEQCPVSFFLSDDFYAGNAKVYMKGKVALWYDKKMNEDLIILSLSEFVPRLEIINKEDL